MPSLNGPKSQIHPFGKHLQTKKNKLSPSTFKSKRLEFPRQSYVTKLREKHSKLLACSRPELAVGPILPASNDSYRETAAYDGDLVGFL